ncbi:uncharacterized protein LOC62_04G005358 [Vanrija pseudolonga]|uniref:Uncharacterized protein n=1 Tax=Vanrija pseudolonga TaxID=143232 RepID=A0AAF1BL70_9TREE|nr:hypothetical protein LOC62_04G005358 [Vanrija pseudolonga]
MTTVAIDYTAHPHIIDAIIAFSSTPVLTKLRCTSRELRDRIDRKMFHHVALLEWRKPNQRTSESKKLFQRPSIRELRVTSAGLTTYAGPESLSTRYPLVPSAVEILDIVHPIRADSFDFDKLTSVHTVRRMNYAVCSVGTGSYKTPHTLVDFCYLYPHARNDMRPIPLLPRASRYVLHLKWEESDTMALWNFFNLGHMDTITEFVLVLHPNPAEDGSRAVMAENYGLIDLVTQTIPVMERGGEVTIVGLERVVPQQLRLHIDAGDEPGIEAYEPFRENLVDHLINQADHFIQGTDEAHHRQSILQRIHFVPLEGWLEGLGNRKELEGVWPSCADDEFKYPQFLR